MNRSSGSHRVLTGTVTVALLLSTAAGCARWGASALEDNHVAFNASVADAMDRQMLLNIVRMAHRRPTQWMNVSLINVQTSVGAGLRGDVPIDGSSGGSVGGSVSFSYSPNITLIPQQGERLARDLMSPIPVSTVERLVSAGWPTELVALFCLEKVGPVQGFDVTNDRGLFVDGGEFGRLLQLLDHLGRQHLISLSQVPRSVTWNTDPIPASEVTIDRIVEASERRSAYIKRPDGGYDFKTLESIPVLTFYEGIEASPDGVELARLLRLPAQAGSFRMVASEEEWPGDTLALRTRSFVATLQLLSMGVDLRPGSPAPTEDLNTESELYAWMAAAVGDQDMAPFVRSVFRIHCSDRRPTNVLVEAHDGRHWYWIDADDKGSRILFAMVRDMFDLQVTGESGAGPVLTLPVGAGR